MRLNQYSAFGLCILALIAGVLLALHYPWLWLVPVVAGVLVVLGVVDLIQPHHSIRCNYPVLGHVRWLVEMIRPEVRQYLIESDQEAAPFSRNQRSLAYSRGWIGSPPSRRKTALSSISRRAAHGSWAISFRSCLRTLI